MTFSRSLIVSKFYNLNSETRFEFRKREIKGLGGEAKSVRGGEAKSVI